MKNTELYRHYDIHGNLLYVGISFSAIFRQIQHKSSSGWWGESVTMKTERYSTREEALAAEVFAIKTESPIYNKTHNVRVRVTKNKYKMSKDTKCYLDVRMAKDVMIRVKRLKQGHEIDGMHYAVIDVCSSIESNFKRRGGIHESLSFDIIDHILPIQELAEIREKDKKMIELESVARCVYISDRQNRFKIGDDLYEEYCLAIKTINVIIRESKPEGNVL